MVLHYVWQVPRPLNVVLKLLGVDEDQRTYHCDEKHCSQVDETVEKCWETHD